MDIRSLSAKSLAGQRLMVGFDGTQFDSHLRYLIDTIKVGGIILFKRNIGTPEALRLLCRCVQDHAGACGQPPLFIAIDQEGGSVARLTKPFTEFDGNSCMKSPADALRFADITADELKRVGINMNFAPVLDVAPREIESIMASRSFGPDPEWVALMGETVIRRLQEKGIMAVAKHFPGIGRTILDSHLDLPVLEVSLPDLETFDLLPFRRAIETDVAGVMLSHIHYPLIDPHWPASLSPVIAGELLREQLNYNGVVMTDDLDMGAIVKHFGFESAIAQVMAADIDLFLICHRSDRIEKGFETILKQSARSQREEDRARASVERILNLKRRFLSGTG
ncbi:MAG: glycoside hydrolase family 3 N-terminal domain-containing protein [Pseudomonadota bacterium]